MVRWGWVLLLVLSPPVGSQAYPDYIEKQIQAGTLTRAEARLLYGSLRPTKPALPPPPVVGSQPDTKASDKLAPYQGTLTGLQVSDLTAQSGAALTGTVYLVKDTPEIQERLQRQTDLVKKQGRTSGPGKIGRPNPPGGIGSPPPGTIGTATGGPGAVLAQLPGFQAIASENALTQTLLQEGKFELTPPVPIVPTALVMAIVQAGDRIVGVWASPAVKDKPVALTPAGAIYWVP
ncbi:hypothetical protein [Candidatus Cyanaurora vandensis]|uniref:hypothetical protein n=1 Tax=Candidatus Cyanaurora vandensis TaxID=2714958 RepID=UPI00257FA470|nr:hypothetical protein [Candidatus Cyanaurora vandensis]